MSQCDSDDGTRSVDHWTAAIPRVRSRVYGLKTVSVRLADGFVGVIEELQPIARRVSKDCKILILTILLERKWFYLGQQRDAA